MGGFSDFKEDETVHNHVTNTTICFHLTVLSSQICILHMNNTTTNTSLFVSKLHIQSLNTIMHFCMFSEL